MQSGAWKKCELALVVLGLGLFGLSRPAFGQLQAGRIVGTVYDPQHATVPSAVVSVIDLATNLSKRVTASSTGDYVVTPLDPGTYRISATATGFQTTVQDGIELVVGQA